MNIKIFILLDKYKVCIYKRILYFVEYGNICYNFRLNKCKLESKSVQVSNRNIYSTGLVDVLDKCKVCTYRSANQNMKQRHIGTFRLSQVCNKLCIYGIQSQSCILLNTINRNQQKLLNVYLSVIIFKNRYHGKVGTNFHEKWNDVYAACYEICNQRQVYSTGVNRGQDDQLW